MHDILKYNGKLDLTNPETLTKVRIRYLGEDYGKDYLERELDHLDIRIRILESGNGLGPHYIVKQDEDKNLVLVADLERTIPSILNEETLNHIALWAKDMENDIRWLKPVIKRCFPKDRLI